MRALTLSVVIMTAGCGFVTSKDLDKDRDGLCVEAFMGVLDCPTNSWDCDDGDDQVGAPDTWFADADGDEYGDPDRSRSACDHPVHYVSNSDDCDDGDADEYPGQIWHTDADGDGFGDAAAERECSRVDDSDVLDATDCDDLLVTVSPAAQEVCNGIDDDCDGAIDGGLPTTDWYPDSDGDGFGDSDSNAVSDCEAPSGTVDNADDCDDADPYRFPENLEIVADGFDQNCDDVDDCYEDYDGDGVGTVTVVPGSDLTCSGNGESVRDDDCDDGDGARYPGNVEVTADGLDQDCDGVDDCFDDGDGDGVGGGIVIDGADLSCSNYGESDRGDDCDDNDSDRFQGNPERVGDGVDQDCDGLEDCYEDLDLDGVGSNAVIVGVTLDCSGGGEAAVNGDPCPDDNPDDTDGDGVCETDDVCAGSADGDDLDSDTVPDGCDACGGFDDLQDADADTVPDGCESCPGSDDLVDTDLDGVPDGCDLCAGFDDLVDLNGNGVPDGCDTDFDGDGSLVGVDCDDTDAGRFPGNPEVAGDGIDQDCDTLDDCYPDGDLDGVGAGIASPGLDLSCTNPGESWENTDCDDGDPLTYPGAFEIEGDPKDQDCDGCIDLWNEDFEAGLDGTCISGTSDWTCNPSGPDLDGLCGTCEPATFTSTLAFGGTQSAYSPHRLLRLEESFGSDSSFEGWFYEPDPTVVAGANLTAVLYDSVAMEQVVTIGWISSICTTSYCTMEGASNNVVENLVPRSMGWHHVEFLLDYDVGGDTWIGCVDGICSSPSPLAGTPDSLVFSQDPAAGPYQAYWDDLRACGMPADFDGDGFTPAKGDCDDTDPLTYPNAPEIRNGRDDDCDGIVDDGVMYYATNESGAWEVLRADPDGGNPEYLFDSAGQQPMTLRVSKDGSTLAVWWPDATLDLLNLETLESSLLGSPSTAGCAPWCQMTWSGDGATIWYQTVNSASLAGLLVRDGSAVDVPIVGFGGDHDIHPGDALADGTVLANVYTSGGNFLGMQELDPVGGTATPTGFGAMVSPPEPRQARYTPDFGSINYCLSDVGTAEIRVGVLGGGESVMTNLAPLTLGSPAGLAWMDARTLAVTVRDNGIFGIYAVNAVTGAATPVLTDPVFEYQSVDMAIDPNLDEGAQLDGIDERIDMGDVLDNDGTSPQTVAFKVNLPSTAAPMVVASKGPLWSRYEYAIASGVVGFILQGNSNNISVAGTTPLVENTDYSIMVTYDGSRSASGVSIYIDGVADTLSVVNDAYTSGASNTSSFMISSRDASGRYFVGKVKDVAYWPDERDSLDAAEFHNAGRPLDLSSMTSPPTHAWLNATAGDDLTAATGVVVDSGSVGGFDGVPVNTESEDLVEW